MHLRTSRGLGQVAPRQATDSGPPPGPLSQREVMLVARSAGDGWGDTRGNIDVYAQGAIVRISRNRLTAADAHELLNAVISRKLRGIFIESQMVPALRAQKRGTWYGTLIPAGEDAVVVPAPAGSAEPPLIAFRESVKEKPIRLDPALVKAWREIVRQEPPLVPPTLGRRVLIPFWVIAHRTNDLNDVQRALKAGANALECDVRWDRDHFVVRHDAGIPFGPFDRPFDFIRWLRGVRQLARTNPGLSLVIFDYKEPEQGRVDLMLRQIRAHLTSDQDAVPLNVIISVAFWKDRSALEPILRDLARHEGVAIDEDATPQQSSQHFDERFRDLAARHRNQAFGAGRFIPKGSVRRRVIGAVALKGLERRIRFVYVWTLNRPLEVAEYLQFGVDGVFVDDPRIALDVLRRPSFRARYRLARRGDRVFQHPPAAAYVLNVKTGSRLNAGTDATIEFELIGEQGHVASTRISARKPGLFERGGIDLVTLRGMDVGRPTRLRVTHDGAGSAPDWFLDAIEVRRPGDPRLYTFRFNRWIRGTKRSR